MKRVLVVCFDFPPQGGTGAIRITKFVKYLPQFGWHPVVVCSDTDWNPDESLYRDIPKNVPVHRVGWPEWVRTIHSAPSLPADGSQAPEGNFGWKPLFQSWVLRKARRLLLPDASVLWTKAARRTCLRVLQAHPCDVILTTSPPHSVHFIGYWLHRHTGLPWVADFRDAWTAQNLVLGRLGRLGLSLQRRMERRMLEGCSRAVMITEPLRQRVLEVFGPYLADKLVTITNGFDPEDFTNPESVPDRDLFTITYTGTILGTQADNAFPDGLRLALSQNELFRKSAIVRFVGQLDPAYRTRLSGLEGNVEVSNYVRHGAAIDLMLRSDLLLLILPNTDESHMVYTNKFFEYLAARRPVLALVPPGLISEIVVHEKVGLVAPPDDPPAIAEALLILFEEVRTRPHGYSISDNMLACFDRRRLTGELAAVLQGAASGK